MGSPGFSGKGKSWPGLWVYAISKWYQSLDDLHLESLAFT
jgi:hypothetical protein